MIERKESGLDILDSLPEIVFECAVGGAVRYINRRGCETLEYACDELVSFNVLDLVCEADRQKLQDLMDGILLENRDYAGVELTFLTKKGMHVPVQIYTSRILDGKGNLEAVRGVAVDVTESRKTLELLIENEAKYRALVEFANDIIYKCSYRGDFLEMNRFGLEKLGYTIEELRALNYTDIIPPEHRESEYAFYRAQLQSLSEEPTYRELPLVRKDGGTLWIAQYVSLVREERYGNFYGFARDVTEFKRIQQELARSEIMFRTMIEESSDIILVVDPGGIIRYESPSVERILGFQPGRVAGHDVFARIHRDDVERMRGLFAECIAHPETLFTGEYRYLNAAGEWRWLEIRGRNLVHLDYIGGVLVNIRDITEEQNLVDELAKREGLYRVITENLTDIIWVLDLETLAFTYLSPSLYRMRGLTQEEGYREPLENIFPPGDLENVMAVLAKELEEDRAGTRDPDKIVTIETQQYRKDRSVYWVEIRASFVRDPSGRAYAIQGSTRDISQRKEAERSLDEYREHLEELVRRRTDELNTINEKLRAEVSEHTVTEERLRVQNEIMLKDLEEARRVQQVLLPGKLVTDRVETGYRYHPMTNVGGDFLSFTSLQEADGVGVFIGDVAGHGVTAALYTFYARSLTDRVCRRWGTSPGDYMGILSAELVKGMKGNYLTGIYGTMIPRKEGPGAIFTFCKGGHPYPVLFRRESRQAFFLTARGTALGLFEGMRYEEQRFDLGPGDRVFLYTDGIPETFDREGNMFGYERFIDIVKKANAYNQPLEDTLDFIMVGIDQFRNQAPIEDDVLLIGIEVRG